MDEGRSAGLRMTGVRRRGSWLGSGVMVDGRKRGMWHGSGVMRVGLSMVVVPLGFAGGSWFCFLELGRLEGRLWT